MVIMSEIRHVSDTALMVAACRAMETARPDGFVRDPFAERLAGERGMAIANALPSVFMMCFGIGVRSRFLDEVVVECVRDRGVRTVLSAGCGLDSRPYRLDVPADLRWIEADFQDMLDYKASVLQHDVPKCRLERVATDVSDPAQRSALFESLGSEPSLMITEGLLMYLPGSTVEALTAAPVTYWASDIVTEAFARRVGMTQYKSIQDVRASDCLSGDATLDVIVRNGWHDVQVKSYLHDLMSFASVRIAAMAQAAAAQGYTPPPIAPDDPTGVHLFGRS
jgi:methyltransferase (TIGR00027 family)